MAVSDLGNTGPQGNGAAGDMRGVLPAGFRLRGYEIVSVLGQGGFGITYLARDTQLNRDVAIKEYLPTSLALREQGQTVVPRSTELGQQFAWGRDRFLEEARTLARLDRAPAIVHVHEFLEANSTAYMVMALAEGEPLDRRIHREGHLGPAAIEILIDQLLPGLEEVHAAGFLHRDIKPANIIVDSRGHPTLVDFGASRAAMVERSTVLTAVFTPGYAAPEQFTSERQGPWTDIYGLAATLHNAITGKTPPSAFDRMLQDDYEPLARLRPRGFAPALLAAIDAGLAVRASDRPQSIEAWRALLAGEGSATVFVPHAVPHAAIPAPSPSAQAVHRAPSGESSGRSPGRSRMLVYGGLAAGLALLLAGGIFVLLPKSIVMQDRKTEDRAGADAGPARPGVVASSPKPAPVPPAQVLIGETRLTLPNTSGIPTCGVNRWWIVQASLQKFEIKTGGAWIAFDGDARGHFAGTFRGGNGTEFTLSGSLKDRTITFRTESGGCTFSGRF